MNNFYIPFSKKDDEQRMVYGYATTEAIDSQGEIVAKTAIEEALPDYMKFGNIREMHQQSAVGKAHEANIDDKGLFLGVKVVDDSAWTKVKEGVYNGFSIGGKIVTKINDTITKLRLTEISLVDRPANPEAVFAFYKGEGMDEHETASSSETEVTISKADEALTLFKGFMGEEVWDAQMALNALSQIMALLGYELSENEQYPEQIEALQTAIKAIKAFIVSEIQEDNGSGENPTLTLSEDATDITKAGASISRANKAKLENIMALCKDLMGDDEKEEEGEPKGEEAEKSETIDDLTKSEDLSKAFDIVKSELDLAKSEISKMSDRIKELESMPTAPKGALNSFGKSSDYEKNGDENQPIIVKNIGGQVNEVASMIKAIHGGQR